MKDFNPVRKVKEIITATNKFSTRTLLHYGNGIYAEREILDNDPPDYYELDRKEAAMLLRRLKRVNSKQAK